MSNLFRHIPAVDKILADERIITLTRELPTLEVTTVIRGSLDQIRREIAAQGVALSHDEIMERLVSALKASMKRKFQPVILS